MLEKKIKIDAIPQNTKLFINNLNNNESCRFKSLQDLIDFEYSEDYDASESFYFGQTSSGLLKSSQLNIDFSKFENHTFFNSANVNTEVAFDKIINYFPFDKNKEKNIKFLESLSGFENWLYNNWPKYKGFINFASGAKNYIEISRNASSNKVIKNNTTGLKIIPTASYDDFALEIWVSPAVSTNNQTIFSLKDSTNTNGVELSVVYDTTQYLNFRVANTVSDDVGNSHYIINNVTSSIILNDWNHVVAEWVRNDDNQYLKLIVNDNETTGSIFYAGDLILDSQSCFIGSGTQWNDLTNNNGFFTGSIDEFRIWGKDLNEEQIKTYKFKNIFPRSGLQCYFKFNEPTGTLQESLVLDSSGNSLHSFVRSKNGTITDFSQIRLEQTSSICMNNENLLFNPVLFPSYDGVINLKEDLLYSASIYDRSNSNLITTMIPQHYIDNSNIIETPVVDSDINDTYNDSMIYSDSIWGETNTQNPKVLLGILYTWAKFFDEMKLFLDAFGDVLSFGVDEFGNSPNTFIENLSKYYGFQVSDLFSEQNFYKFFDFSSCIYDEEQVLNTLSNIRDSLWKRIFHSLPYILKSKGTINSIRSFLKSYGINSDRIVKFVEYGGTKESYTDDDRINKSDILKSCIFSDQSIANSPYLSSSLYDSQNNGILTSQSFCFQTMFKLNMYSPITSSLLRIQTSSSLNNPTLLANILLFNPEYLNINEGKTVSAYCLPYSGSSNLLELRLNCPGFEENKFWNVAFGRNVLSGSDYDQYYLYLSNPLFGSSSVNYFTSSLYPKSSGIEVDLFSSINQLNLYGPYIELGNNSIPYNVTCSCLNGTPYTYSNFNGEISQVRFWSKFINQEEFLSHVYNPFSLGSSAVKNIYNLTNITGSKITSNEWERLRLDCNIQDQTLNVKNNNILFMDLSRNTYPISTNGQIKHSGVFSYTSGSLLFTPSSSNIIKNYENFYSYPNDCFDEPTIKNKIKFINDQQPFDYDKDNRFSIEMSISSILNEDITNMLYSIDQFNDFIGGTEKLFSYDYHQLNEIRENYFNRIEDKIKIKLLFNLFKWFDSNLYKFIKQLVPARTNFIGNNMVLNGHLLERNKHKYNFYSQYLDKENLSMDYIDKVLNYENNDTFNCEI